MAEVEAEVYLNQGPAFFVELTDGLHRAENIMNLKDAAAAHLVDVVTHRGHTLIIAQTDLTQQGKNVQLEVLESHHNGQVKGTEVTLVPPKNCESCNVPLKSRTVISDEDLTHINCPNCSTRNDCTVSEKQKTFGGVVITDDRTFEINFEGAADDVLNELKTAKEKLGDVFGAKDTPLEDTLKPMGNDKIRVWDFENDGDVDIDDLCIQVGDLKTSVRKAEDLSVYTEDDDEPMEEPEEYRKPEMSGKLKLEFVEEESTYDVLLIKSGETASLPLYVDYDGQNPSRVVVSSEALTKGGWTIKGTEDYSDSQPYYDALSIAEDTGLLDDDGDWEVESDSPFGQMSVEYPSDDDGSTPAWSERMTDAELPPTEKVLYISLTVPNGDLQNIKISHSSSHGKTGKKK